LDEFPVLSKKVVADKFNLKNLYDLAFKGTPLEDLETLEVRKIINKGQVHSN
jgi:hypothetical protein